MLPVLLTSHDCCPIRELTKVHSDDLPFFCEVGGDQLRMRIQVTGMKEHPTPSIMKVF